MEVEDGQIRSVQVIGNSGATYEYGSGPIAVKTLADLKVDLVLAVGLGPGASGLLEHHHVRKVSVKPNIKLAVKRAL